MAPSGHVVLWPLSPLGNGPIDVLVRRLDVARLAVDAAVARLLAIDGL